MRILSQYIRDGAPVAVPLSVHCRKTTLRFRASSAFIFGMARAEILEKMTTDENQHEAMMVRTKRLRMEDWGVFIGSLFFYPSVRQHASPPCPALKKT